MREFFAILLMPTAWWFFSGMNNLLYHLWKTVFWSSPGVFLLFRFGFAFEIILIFKCEFSNGGTSVTWSASSWQSKLLTGGSEHKSLVQSQKGRTRDSKGSVSVHSSGNGTAATTFPRSLFYPSCLSLQDMQTPCPQTALPGSAATCLQEHPGNVPATSRHCPIFSVLEVWDN